jgi:DNA repair protein RecN (Recombination protein N)
VLVELAVENYAVLEKIRVRFQRGLNLLTGETGSGKSLVVDALGLLLGGRASADAVRAGAASARVSGIFEMAPCAGLQRLLADAGVEPEDGELLVEREILAGGKSRAFAGSRPATAAFLRELAPYLGDIHGQHDQQQLFSRQVQRDMLDAFAGATAAGEQVRDLYLRWRRTSRELEELERGAQESLRMADLWEFQRKEIESTAPRPGEDAQLENERRVLRNLARLQETAAGAYGALCEDPDNAASRLRTVQKRLEEMAHIDASASEIAAALDPARLAVEEASHALRDYLGKLEADPGRLEEVEARLAALEKLKRKYGSTLEEVLRFLEEARRNLASVESSSTRQDALRKETAGLAGAYREAADRLAALRREAAKLLARKVESELGALAMDKARVEIRVEPAEWSESGADAVVFLVATNPGEEPKALEKIASGGELSRLALALKTCAAPPAGAEEPAAPRTLVFDEIDSGIGGSAAEAVGRRLKKLASSSQVLCVTHLPQIAGFAHHHYFVEKTAARGRTVATIQELSPEQRTREIGRMLSGETVTAEAIRNAQSLIKMAGRA